MMEVKSEFNGRIGVVGAGIVGRAMQEFLGPNTVVYDPKPGWPHDKAAINECEVVFVCVPTPEGKNGTCDTSIVEDTVAWLETPLIILRSTVPPGTTDRLMRAYNKHIVFQPEYLGETLAHPLRSIGDRTFVILGGDPQDTSRVADLYKKYYNSTVRFFFSDATTAEMAKYMGNAFYGLKVSFVNEFYDIAEAHGVNFNVLRELWLADPRIHRDHTFVYPENRGFGGKCLPKDIKAIVQSSAERGHQAFLLRAVLEANERLRATDGASASACPSVATHK